MNNVNWGILGTGNIAHKFAEGLTALPDANLVAVGSRTQASADVFADRFQVPHRYASYQDLADDADIDAVYIATPHHLHRENSLLCLERGKAVICEKPFAINRAQASEMVEMAGHKQLFLMEAMWTRFMPLMVKLREMMAQEVIGELRMLTADFGFRTGYNPKGRLFDPAMGGGALLDVGIYPVSLAHMLFGAPQRITAMAHLGESGVDEQAAVILGYGKGELALLSTAVRTNTPQEAYLLGSAGRIKIHHPWWYPSQMSLQVAGEPEQVIAVPYEGNGYNYEAAEVMACLRAGKIESDIMSLDESLLIMATLDHIRQQWGLKYPVETE